MPSVIKLDPNFSKAALRFFRHAQNCAFVSSPFGKKLVCSFEIMGALVANAYLNTANIHIFDDDKFHRHIFIGLTTQLHSVCVLLYSFVRLSVARFIPSFAHTSPPSPCSYPSVRLSIQMFMCKTICITLRLSIVYSSIAMPVYLFVYISIPLYPFIPTIFRTNFFSAHLRSIRQPVRSNRLHVKSFLCYGICCDCAYLCLPVRLHFHSTSFFFTHSPIQPPVHPSTHRSAHPSIHFLIRSLFRLSIYNTSSLHTFLICNPYAHFSIRRRVLLACRSASVRSLARLITILR